MGGEGGREAERRGEWKCRGRGKKVRCAAGEEAEVEQVRRVGLLGPTDGRRERGARNNKYVQDGRGGKPDPPPSLQEGGETHGLVPPPSTTVPRIGGRRTQNGGGGGGALGWKWG